MLEPQYAPSQLPLCIIEWGTMGRIERLLFELVLSQTSIICSNAGKGQKGDTLETSITL